MRKFIKILAISLLGLFILGLVAFGGFYYKVRYGLPFFESTPPEISMGAANFSVLLFNKTNGFRHSAAIESSTLAFQEMAKDRNWNLFVTESGAVFNEEQLSLFDVVIWNNVTGPVLTEEQRTAFRAYMENGGGYVGIHGAGDFSHYWDWYENTLIGATFSHHTMNPGIQPASMHLECDSSGFHMCQGLDGYIERSDEWYVFLDNPREKGFTVLYTVDEETFDPNGNFLFLARNKDFGMGADHPIVWFKELPGGGRTFYSALGHAGEAFQEDLHLQMLKNAIEWTGKTHIP
ncbi:MAG: ThuA domain-containing protein [Bacteroidota bacterium]